MIDQNLAEAFKRVLSSRIMLVRIDFHKENRFPHGVGMIFYNESRFLCLGGQFK